MNDFTDIIMETIDEYMNEHFNILSEPYFEDILTQDILNLFFPIIEHEKKGKYNSKKIEYNELDDQTQEELEQDIQESIQHYFSYIIPRRSFQSSFTFKNPDIEKIEKQLEYLRNKPQPAQRTEEWYQFRHNLITASELHKVFDSQAVKNSLIYSKCKPWVSIGKCNNTDSPLHWGQKYEPLSVILYENIYETKIEEFGCIKHDIIQFIGASPDGINVDKTSQRYGRLLEIKNVLSREIDGIPLKEYWIQMQAQMEVCNLDECDFLETKFVEYSCYREYMEDKFVQGSYSEYESDNDSDNEKEQNTYCPYKYKGCIMMFVLPNTNTPEYEFKPLMLNDDDEETIWEEETIKKKETDGYKWIKNIYWKLQVFSCVLVLRNKFWFNSCIPQMKDLWDTIEVERLNGYEHRAPKSRIKKIEVTLLQKD